MGKKYSMNVLFVISLCLVLLTGMGCTKKISTTDNIMGDRGSEVVEDLTLSQENFISNESSRSGDGRLDPDSLVLKIEDIFFDFDKDTIRPESYSILDKNIQVLKDNPDKQIIIEGHTDERGTNEYNLTLSERRSRTTRRYIVARGIAPERIMTITYGEERPFCSEQTEECYQLNRRAHFAPSK